MQRNGGLQIEREDTTRRNNSEKRKRKRERDLRNVRHYRDNAASSSAKVARCISITITFLFSLPYVWPPRNIHFQTFVPCVSIRWTIINSSPPVVNSPRGIECGIPSAPATSHNARSTDDRSVTFCDGEMKVKINREEFIKVHSSLWKYTIINIQSFHEKFSLKLSFLDHFIGPYYIWTILYLDHFRVYQFSSFRFRVNSDGTSKVIFDALTLEWILSLAKRSWAWLWNYFVIDILGKKISSTKS